jgi:hypothetical protein
MMMFGFILFPAGLLALAGLGVALIAGIIMFVRGNVPRRNWALWAGVPLGCGCLPLLLMLVPIFSGVVWSALRPDSWAFEEVFAVDPPASISELDASTNPGLDSRAIYLAFESNPAIKAWLTRQTLSWTSVARSDWVDSDAFQGSPPNWWKGASSGFAPHGCARPVHREFRDVDDWRDLAIIDCLSDRRVYVIVQHID